MHPQSVKYELACFQISLFDHKVLLLDLKLAICLFWDITSENGDVSANFFCVSNPDDTNGRGSVLGNGFTLVELSVYWAMQSHKSVLSTH